MVQQFKKNQSQLELAPFNLLPPANTARIVTISVFFLQSAQQVEICLSQLTEKKWDGLVATKE
jgi:hypothetical protein